MGHWVRGMFASPGRSRGACAVHSLWQQKDCQRCLWWVSHAHTHTHTSLCSQTYGMFTLHDSLVPVCSKIKVWDLQAALDPRAPASTLCLRTLVVRDAAVLLAFVFWLTRSLTLGCLVSQNLEWLCSSSMIRMFLLFSFLTGAFGKSVPASVWWVSDHQQFPWRHHSDLGFPERLH